MNSVSFSSERITWSAKIDEELGENLGYRLARLIIATEVPRPTQVAATIVDVLAEHEISCSPELDAVERTFFKSARDVLVEWEKIDRK